MKPSNTVFPPFLSLQSRCTNVGRGCQGDPQKTLGLYWQWCAHTPENKVEGLLSSLFFFIYVALVSPFAFEKPAAVRRKRLSGNRRTSKYRCKVKRTSDAPCGHRRRRVR